MATDPTPQMRIGELAERTGRSVHAIRWYEAQGLLPGVLRNAAGRRLYGERHVGWLELMERLRSTGMSIAQMRAYTALVMQGRRTLPQRQQQLAAHRAQVEARIAEWKTALKELDRKLAFYADWVAQGARPPMDPQGRPLPRPRPLKPKTKTLKR
jgi:DNA-binding transcriptional MerR regulator